MKKNTLYTVNKWNRPAFIQDRNVFDLGGVQTTNLGNTNFSGYQHLDIDSSSIPNLNTSTGSSAGGFNMGSLGSAIGGNIMGMIDKIPTGDRRGLWDTLDPGYNAGKTKNGHLETKLGNALSDIGISLTGGGASGALGSLGGMGSGSTGGYMALAGAAFKVIGDVINNGWGTAVNQEELDKANKNIDYGKNFKSSVTDLDKIKLPESFQVIENPYSGGVFKKGWAKRKNAELQRRNKEAYLFANNSVNNNINNIINDTQNKNLAYYRAFGGPMNYFGSGALGIMQNDKYLDAINNRSNALANNNIIGQMPSSLTLSQNRYDEGGALKAAFLDNFSKDPMAAVMQYNEGLEALAAAREARQAEAAREAEYTAMQQRLANLETQNQGMQALMDAYQTPVTAVPEVEETPAVSSPSKATHKPSGNKNWDYIENQFRTNSKLNDAQILGAKYNLQRESSINPDAVGDNGAALGLAQWHGDRRPSDMSLEGQTAHYINTLLNYDGNKHWIGRENYEGFMNARTPEEAHYYIAKGYERPRADIVERLRKEAEMSLKNINAKGGKLYALGGEEDLLSDVDYRSDSTTQGYHEGIMPFGAGNYAAGQGPLSILEAPITGVDNPYLITGEAPLPGMKATNALEALQMVKAMKAAKAAKAAKPVSRARPVMDAAKRAEISAKGVEARRARMAAMTPEEIAAQNAARSEKIKATWEQKHANSWQHSDNSGAYSRQDLNGVGLNSEDLSRHIITKRGGKTWVPSKKAFGGELGTNGTDWTNGLLEVNTGGSHEENPLDGVPMGLDAEGTPNLVEEGETVYNDYVFSDRMNVPAFMYKELGLGGVMKKKGKGMSFADASKKLAMESEQRPNDPISQAGLEASLAKLAQVQETERMRKQMEEYVGLQEYACGGKMKKYAYGGDKGNMFGGNGGKAQQFNLDDDRSFIRRILGDTRFTDFMENASQAMSDPLNYFAGDEIEAMMNGIAEMSEPQLEKFFNTDIGQNVAIALVNMEGTGTKAQEAGVNRWYKATGRMAKPVQKAVMTAAKRSVQQSKLNAKGQMRTPKGGGKPTSVTETKTPAQVAREGAAAYKAQRDARLPALRNPSEVATIGGRELAPIGQTGLTVTGSTALTPFTRGTTALTTVPGTPKAGFPWGILGGAGALGALGYALNGSDENEVVGGTAPGSNKGHRFINDKGEEVVVPATVDDPLTQALIDALPSEKDKNPGIADVTFDVDEARRKFHDSLQADYMKLPEGPIIKDRLDTSTDNNGKEEQNPDTYATWMRYAPVVGSGIMSLTDALGLTNKPDYTYADKLEAAANAAGYAPNISYDPIGNYLTYKPFDRLFYANQLQANARATDRALTNTNSPSRAASLLANGYNTTNALGNLYRQAEEYNLNQRKEVEDFNRRTNMFNSQMGLEAAMANARYRQQAGQLQLSGLAQAAALRDSIDARTGAAKAANLTNFFTSLGNIGRENFAMNQINDDDAYSYGVRSNGTTPFKKKRSCGGKMNKHK